MLFIVSLLFVFFLGIKATLMMEFMEVLFLEGSVLSYIREAWRRLLTVSVKS
jgi:hypothetical protein